MVIYGENISLARKIVTMSKQQKRKEKKKEKQLKESKIQEAVAKEAPQQSQKAVVKETPQLVQEDQQQSPPKFGIIERLQWRKVVRWIVVVFIIGSILTPIAHGFLEGIGENIAIRFEALLNLPNRVTDLETLVEGINETVTKDHEKLLVISAINYSSINEQLDEAKVVILSDGNEIGTKETFIKKNEILSSEPNFSNSKKELGVNSSGDTEDILSCQNTPLIIPYTSGDSEIFFSGQYNENGHWNGKCTFNIYKENKLDSIYEEVYDDGSLYSYKSVIIDSGGNWRVNDRTCRDEFNLGETWTYRKSDDFDKLFLTEDVGSKDILSVDDFLDLVDEDIMSYYNGNTSDGTYNDKNKNGKTYFVGFFLPEEYEGSGEKPVIRTLYNGKFEGGKFKEDEYESWYITRETNTKYMYFKGCFENNTKKAADSSKEVMENPLSFERINELLEENNFTGDYKGEFCVDYEIE